MNHSNKHIYKEFCSLEPEIPLFSKDWWLDAVCGNENWDVAIVKNNNEIIASMPYFISKRFGFKIISQPPMTQVNGPWIKAKKAKKSKILDYEKKVMNELINQLPQFDYFSQNWLYKYKNWYPFFLKGYKQTTRYTHILFDISDEQKNWDGLGGNIRGEIRKAKNRFKLTIDTEPTIEKFLDLYQMTYKRQGRKPHFENDQILTLDYECKKNNCRKIFLAKDNSGEFHAGIYIVWDENAAYYILGGADPSLRNSGAHSFAMWEAIRFSSSVTKRFDFEGSMEPSIERFFRNFGTDQTPYFSIRKTNSNILKLLEAMSLFKKNNFKFF